MTSPRVVFLAKCWRAKPHCTQVEASEGGEEVLSAGKYFDKFVCGEGDRERRWQWGRNKNREVVLLFLLKLEKLERFKS